MIQNPMSSQQIMYILNQNPIMKTMINTLIQNPLMMQQMNNILNILIYNQTIMNELKNVLNLEMNMNMNNQINMITNNIMEEESIQIIFERLDKQDKQNITVQCRPSEKFADVIKRYRNKSLDNEEKEKFIYNLYSLNPNLTVGEQGLVNLCTIKVIKLKVAYGGSKKINPS